MNETEEKKIERHTLLIYIIAILTLLVAIIGATFAWFSAKIIGNENASSVLIKSSSLTIEYLASNEINEKNIGPGFSKNLTFTISNNSGGTAGYKLYWLVGTNEFVGNDLVYSLTATSNKTGDKFVTANQTVIPKVTEQIGTGVIPTGNVQTYTLNVSFLNRDADQNDDKGKAFAGKIEVRSN